MTAIERVVVSMPLSGATGRKVPIAVGANDCSALVQLRQARYSVG
jgi:hypothetical protein